MGVCLRCPEGDQYVPDPELFHHIRLFHPDLAEDLPMPPPPDPVGFNFDGWRGVVLICLFTAVAVLVSAKLGVLDELFSYGGP